MQQQQNKHIVFTKQKKTTIFKKIVGIRKKMSFVRTATREMNWKFQYGKRRWVLRVARHLTTYYLQMCTLNYLNFN